MSYIYTIIEESLDLTTVSIAPMVPELQYIAQYSSVRDICIRA